jgi:hypothetical protein
MFDLGFSNSFVFYSRLSGMKPTIEFPLTYLLSNDEVLLNVFFLPSMTTAIFNEVSLIIPPNLSYDFNLAKLDHDDIVSNPLRMRRHCHFIPWRYVWFI